jgi:hypothetical protein
MSGTINGRRALARLSVLFLTAALVAGCGANAQRGAAEGGATGAVAGAVGAMVGALVFGGNVAEAGARGAVVGGASGATVGAMRGSQRDSAEAARREAERAAKLDVLKNDLGPDAYNGIIALAECKFGVAIANAREAQSSRNRDHALAGYWVEILTEQEQGNAAAADALLETVVEKDRRIDDIHAARSELDLAIDNLALFREEYGRNGKCR